MSEHAYRTGVSAALDEAGLSMAAFRLLAHYIRRCGTREGTCWGGRASACKICRMSTNTIKVAREELIRRNMIKVISGGSRQAYVVQVIDEDKWLAEDANLAQKSDQIKSHKVRASGRYFDQSGAKERPDLAQKSDSKYIPLSTSLSTSHQQGDVDEQVNVEDEKLIAYWEERDSAQDEESCDIATQDTLNDITSSTELSTLQSFSDSITLLPTPKAPAPPAAVGLTWAEAVALKSAQRKSAKSAKSTAANAAELDCLAQMLLTKWPTKALQAGLPAIRPALRRAWQLSRLSMPAFVHDIEARLDSALIAWGTWTEATPPSQVHWLADGHWAAPIKAFASKSITHSADTQRRF